MTPASAFASGPGSSCRPFRGTLAGLLLCWFAIGGLAQAQDAPAPDVQAPIASAQAAPSFESAVNALPDASYPEKQALVEQLAQTPRKETLQVLNALLDGRLLKRDSDSKVFIADIADGGLALTDAVTLESAGTVPDEGFQKIGTNNQLRKSLKGAIARLKLRDEDEAVRLSAVSEMLRSLDESTVAALREARAGEASATVQRQIDVGLALADLESADAEVRLAAVHTLDGELGADGYNRLLLLTQKAADGSYAEPDPKVRTAAEASVRHIEFWRTVYGSVETLFFGLSLGSVLVLAAIGLAITFGVMGVINMAHGELIMLGAYTTYVMQLLMPNHIGASVLLSIPAAFMISGLVGVAIERGIVKFLYGRPLETLLATFGLSLILQQAVRSIFSPLNRSVQTPEFMSGTLQFNGALSLTYNRLYIVLFTVLVFIALQLILKKTSLGLKVRAVSQNRRMAKAMGIRSEWVDAATFGLGSGIAGVAGVALSQLTNVGPNLGQAYIIDSFMVVVFGGVGNLWGTMIGGMTLGIVNKLLEPYSGAVLAKILVLVALILFIQRKPRGLFPQKGRAAEGH